MIKKATLALLLTLSAAVGNTVSAQTPTQMQYSLRLTDYANKEVSVRMELRQGSMDGTTVWFQQFDTEADAKGTCNLLLDFGSNIDWSNTPYYIVAKIDDKEIGGSLLTSVPYALHAAEVDGFITKKELIGRWESYAVSSVSAEEYKQYSLLFNEDGTGEYIKYYPGEVINESGSFEWFLQNGTIALKETTGSDKFTRAFSTLRISATSFYTTKFRYDGEQLFNKVTAE